MADQKITVFANFYIDTEERFLRLKDSFFSLNHQSISQWVINIRGKYSKDVLSFLRSELGQLLSASELNTNDGWMRDSLKVVDKVQNQYLFFWIEDHLFIKSGDEFKNLISDIYASKVDYIGYSWFGQGKFLEEFSEISKEEFDNLYSIFYSNETNNKRQKNSLNIIGSYSYIISCCGIFQKEFFIKLLKVDKPFLPRWSKFTPFNFEKRWDDIYILPINYGILKREFFVSIDDDNRHPGSCLISRNLYPERIGRSELLKIREKSIDHLDKSLLRIYSKRIPGALRVYLFLKRIGYFFE
jgi:hypothetical protein